MKLRFLTACLHLLQPLARLSGRLRQGLTLWRTRVITGFAEEVYRWVVPGLELIIAIAPVNVEEEMKRW